MELDTLKDINKALTKMRADISRYKNRLAKIQIYENFGDTEIRKLKDKYFDLEWCSDYRARMGYYHLLNEFSEWCATQEWR